MLAEEFKQAFLEVRSERIEAEEARNQIIAAYPHNGLWTRILLARHPESLAGNFRIK